MRHVGDPCRPGRRALSRQKVHARQLRGALQPARRDGVPLRTLLPVHRQAGQTAPRTASHVTRSHMCIRTHVHTDVLRTHVHTYVRSEPALLTVDSVEACVSLRVYIRMYSCACIHAHADSLNYNTLATNVKHKLEALVRVCVAADHQGLRVLPPLVFQGIAVSGPPQQRHRVCLGEALSCLYVCVRARA